MNLHPNSLTAYHSTARQRASIEELILGLMSDGSARTDRQICRELELTEPCRPRITELVETGRLHEVGSTVCEFTGRKARLTKRFL